MEEYDDDDVVFSDDPESEEAGQERESASEGDAEQEQRPAAPAAPALGRSDELLGGELSSEAAFLQLQVGAIGSLHVGPRARVPAASGSARNGAPANGGMCGAAR